MKKTLYLRRLTAALAFVSCAATAGHDHAWASAATAVPDATWLVEFVEPGLLHYWGGEPGYAATAPSFATGLRLDAGTSAAQRYAAYLSTQRQTHLAAIAQALGRTPAASHAYAVVMNGAALHLSAAEAERIARLPGIAAVRPAGTEHLATYRGPRYIGADHIWDGSAVTGVAGTRGQGVVVGIIDGGANPGLASLANDAACGLDAAHPKLVAVDCSTSDAGTCTGPDPTAGAGFGHGVHTATTVAGNDIDNTATPAPLLPDGVRMSGVAPCARIRQYKVCPTNSCDGAAIVAAIENAIVDQVDVINFSISGGTSPWSDADRYFLDAVGADIFVAAAAGNNSAADPTVVARVNHLGPWVTTVAAATQDELIGPEVSAVGPGTPAATLQHLPLTPGTTTHTASTVDLAAHPLLTYPANPLGCAAPGYPPNYFAGAIALVRRGTCTFVEKITAAANAGAVLVIISNNQAGALNMDTTGAPALPAFAIADPASGDALIAFADANNPPPPDPDRVFRAGFEPLPGARVDYARAAPSSQQGDVLANFSYRGPTPGMLSDVTKPDIAAPGVNIYAGTDVASGDYAFMSGTSMASPHLAGAAALLRAVHPGWSPAEIGSALQTTAGRAGTKEDRITPWDTDDVGGGRVDVARAARAGLTLDETYAHYLAANPANGGDVRTLNRASIRNVNCPEAGCSWTRSVTNRLATTGTWSAAFQVLAGGVTGSVAPTTFTLAPGATQVLTVTATPPAGAPQTDYADIVLTETGNLAPVQHLSVTVRQGNGMPAACAGIYCGLQIDGWSNGSLAALGNVPAASFIWLNRFTPSTSDFPFDLDRVEVTFPGDLGNGTTGAVVGEHFDLYIYLDNDGDPANGATPLASVTNVAVTAPLGSAQGVPLPSSVHIGMPGDVLVAVVNRDHQGAYPAAADDGAPYAGRSWVGAAGLGQPPDLSAAGLVRVDAALPGFTHNFVLRAYGLKLGGRPVQLVPGVTR